MIWTYTERYPLLIPPGTHLPGYLLLAWRFASNVYWEEELGNFGVVEAALRRQGMFSCCMALRDTHIQGGSTNMHHTQLMH